MMNMKKLGMPTCSDVSRLVSESHDRPMSWMERARMRLHLAMCRYCLRFQRQLDVLHTAIEKDKRGDTPGD